MNSNNILFIYAHMDDETILSYGTILKYKELGYNVSVICLCGNGRSNNIQNFRKNAFEQNLKNENIKFISYDNDDLSLTKNIIDRLLTNIFINYKPNIIFTHSNVDLHFEHRLIAQEMLVFCRKTHINTVKEVYFTISPTYDWTYNQFGIFQPNLFIDISKFINKKIEALKLYKNELSEDINDIRSIESIIEYNRKYGRIMNTSYCEAYQQIFKLW